MAYLSDIDLVMADTKAIMSAVFATGLVSALLIPAMMSTHDMQLVSGKCPAFGPEVFRSQPYKGTELPNCAWRAWSTGSCVKYPYDNGNIGQVTMGDPMQGRHSGAGFGQTGDCATLQGLAACAVYSPHVGDFLTAMSTSASGTSSFSLVGCPKFCGQLAAHCGGSALGACQSAGFDSMAATGTNCFSAAPSLCPGSLLAYGAMALAAVMATM